MKRFIHEGDAATKMRARRAGLNFIFDHDLPKYGGVAGFIERCQDRALVAKSPLASVRLTKLAAWLTDN